jgi:exosortase A-associated hydrolase 2
MNTPTPGHAGRPAPEPGFIELGNRRLYAVQWRPAGPLRGTVVYVPPFAEELNRCRTLAADAARALAADGWRCVLADLHATGESDGDTAEADWDTWVADTVQLLRALGERGGETVLWGMRTGALIAAEVAAQVPEQVSRLLLWQPVLDGSLFLNQYLRLRIASQVVHTGNAAGNTTGGTKETTDSLRQRLAAGEVLEIGGYPLPGPLAQALSGRKLAALAGRVPQPVAWVEVATQAGAPASPASRKLIETWPTPIRLETVGGQMVWQVHERADAPEMVQATRRLLGQAGA